MGLTHNFVCFCPLTNLRLCAIMSTEREREDNQMRKIINLDMDGTWADLYSVEGWLDDLINSRTRPYEETKPLVNLSHLARVLNRLQAAGYEINVISWTSKNSTEEYHRAVIAAKMAWLKKHLRSVRWDNLMIVEYGTPKNTLSEGYLFDDEARNREMWGEGANDVQELIAALRQYQ